MRKGKKLKTTLNRTKTLRPRLVLCYNILLLLLLCLKNDESRTWSSKRSKEMKILSSVGAVGE